MDGIGGGAKARVRAEVMKRDTIKKKGCNCVQYKRVFQCVVKDIA